MKIFLLLALGIGAATACAQPNDAPATIKTGVVPRVPADDIERNVRGFAAALSGKDAYNSGVVYVFGAKVGFYGGSEWAKEWAKQRGEAHLQIERVESKVEGETATAQVFYRWQTPLFRSELLQERLALRFAEPQNGDELLWQIVPFAPDDKAAPRLLAASPPFLNDAASVIANPQPAVNGARARATLSNLKQLSLAVLQFMQDYDEIYAFAPEYAEEALAPYAKDASLWKVPGRDEKYRFNGNLSEKDEAQVAKPAQTVLFYEGADQTPIFRYDGKAAIGFADGHAALVSRDEAKSLIWKP